MGDIEFGERMFIGIYTVDARNGSKHPSRQDSDSEDGLKTGKRYCISTESSGDDIWLVDADEVASQIVRSLSYRDEAEYLLRESQHSLETLAAALGEFNVEYDIEQAVESGIVPFDSFYQTPYNEAPELHTRWEEGQYREMEMTEKMTLLQHIRDRLEFEYGDLLEEPSAEE